MERYKKSRASSRSGSLRIHAWQLIRIRQRVTVEDLLFILDDEKHGANPAPAIRKFVRQLELVGVLRLATRKVKSQTTARLQHLYILQNDLGPKCPVWRQVEQEVYDPNSGGIWPRLDRLPADPTTHSGDPS